MSSISAGLSDGTALVSTGDTTGELVLKTNGGTTAVTIGTDQSATFAGAVSSTALTVNSNNISADNSLGFRNRIINGDMRIDQRNAGASVSVVNAAYPVDRFRTLFSGGCTATVQQSTTAPTGFLNSFVFTVTSGVSSTSLQQVAMLHRIEGNNVADLMWGTANAKTVTLSFWVRSSLIGTYCVNLKNSAVDRSYVATYTIDLADTWEQKTITIAGDTSGTWLTTSNTGIAVSWDLKSGSSFETTAGSWVSGSYNNTSAQVDFAGTTGATWYITGVQLEVGSVATPFERLDYGRQLIQCQRYYQESGSISGYFYNSTGGGRGVLVGSVPMRASPTLSTTTGSLNIYYSNTAASGTFTFTASGAGLAYGAATFFAAQTPVTTSTTGQGWAGDNNATVRRVTMSAEL